MLTEERNVNDRPTEGPDGWVRSVHATRAEAEAAYHAALDDAKDDGKILCHDPREPDNARRDGDEWDVDFAITEWPVGVDGVR